MNCGIIILAAGASIRLGEPKQLLLLSGKTLLQRAIQAAVESGCRPIIVVLGANFNLISPIVDTSTVTIAYNPEWAEGMASSIHKGVSELQQHNSAISNVILMLCDQPFVNAQFLKSLIQRKAETEKNIIACAYNDTLGVPALFDKQFFDKLLSLKGQEGARKFILQYAADVDAIPFPNGAFDIDTMDDFQAASLNLQGREES